MTPFPLRRSFSPQSFTALLLKRKNYLAFGLPEIDKVFPGLELGEFAVLHGHPLCTFLAFLLCVRSQLPKKLKGLESSVVFNDGGNTFDPYTVSSIAREYSLDPEKVLDRIFISRAFTAYQLAALIFEKSGEALRKYKSKLLVISEITTLFLDRDIPKTESMNIFNKLASYLSQLASEEEIIILATSIPRSYSLRSLYFNSVLMGRARTVITLKETKASLKFSLEKHRRVKPFSVEFPSNGVTIDMFMEA